MKINSLRNDIRLLTSEQAIAWCAALGVDYTIEINDAYKELRTRANADTQSQKPFTPQG